MKIKLWYYKNDGYSERGLPKGHIVGWWPMGTGRDLPVMTIADQGICNEVILDIGEAENIVLRGFEKLLYDEANQKLVAPPEEYREYYKIDEKIANFTQQVNEQYNQAIDDFDNRLAELSAQQGAFDKIKARPK